MATGSYEGPLPMEGIPDHHEAQAFTSRRQRWSRRSPHSPTRTNPLKRRTYGKACSAREGERGVRVNRSSRQGCQRLGRPQRRGKITPTLVSPGREAVELEISVDGRSAEAVLGRRETSGPPVNPHGA
jgi:hypothetical protein